MGRMLTKILPWLPSAKFKALENDHVYSMLLSKEGMHILCMHIHNVLLVNYKEVLYTLLLV